MVQPDDGFQKQKPELLKQNSGSRINGIVFTQKMYFGQELLPSSAKPQLDGLVLVSVNPASQNQRMAKSKSTSTEHMSIICNICIKLVILIIL